MTTPVTVKLWRSVEDLNQDAAVARLASEVPGDANPPLDPIRRRDVLRLMGASLALAGLNACSRTPTEQIVPYVHAPEEFVPGQPLSFATAMSIGGYAKGLLVTSHMGRPTKIEGNPQLSRVPLRIRLGLYDDETSALCHWHIPEAHYLEAWGDTRAFDGTTSIVQPLIAPLYAGKSSYELLATLAGQPDRSGYAAGRSTSSRRGSDTSWSRRSATSAWKGAFGSRRDDRPVQRRPAFRDRPTGRAA